MALAILELDSVAGENARFRIDTGTNRYYRLKAGRSRRKTNGIEWVDDVYFTSPLGVNAAGGSLLDSRKEITMPIRRLDKGDVYVQLFSFKSPEGKSPGFSEVLVLPGSVGSLVDPPARFSLPSSILLSSPGDSMTAAAFSPPRRVPCCTGIEAFAKQTSLGELLGEIAKVAVPLIAGLLKDTDSSGNPGAGSPAASGAASGSSTPGAASAQAPISGAGADSTQGQSSGAGATPAAGSTDGPVKSEDVKKLLDFIVGNAVPETAPAMSFSQSWADRVDPVNRFAPARGMGRNPGISKAFDGGIITFLGPLLEGLVKVLPGVVGPIAQNAPQIIKEANETVPLMINTINQRDIQSKQADNKLATDILSNENNRIILERFLNSQQAASPARQDGLAALGQLIGLLQQQAAAASAPVASTPVASTPVATAPVTLTGAAEVWGAPIKAPAKTVFPGTLSIAASNSPVPSGRAVLSFVAADPLAWYGSQGILFARDRDLRFRLRLSITAPVPTAPLPKAIVKLVFRDPADKTVLLEKSYRQKDLSPGGELAFAIDKEEAARLPANRSLDVLAELRWPNPATGAVSAAFGSTGIVLVDKYFLKQQGSAVSAEFEPKDMTRFRPFWNKVWESPVIDEAGTRSGRPRQVLWSLDVNAKYTVLLSPDQVSNGLMETRLLKEKTDSGDVSDRTEGRLKGGIELSIAEMNKLLPSWSGEAMLDGEKLRAFSAKAFALGSAMELIYNLKLRGKAGQRGIVWVAPVFKVFEFTLCSVKQTNEAGQVTAAAEETVRFPMPVAGRILGLKSQDGSEDGEADAGYAFEGFKVMVNEKISLTPVPLPLTSPGARRAAP